MPFELSVRINRSRPISRQFTFLFEHMENSTELRHMNSAQTGRLNPLFHMFPNLVNMGCSATEH